MRKATVLFTLMLTIGLLCGGTAFAVDDIIEPPSVDVNVEDENGDPVVVAECGDEVTVEVDAWAGIYENWETPVWSVVFVEVPDDLVVDVDGAMMWDDSEGVWYENDDPFFGGFFYWNEPTNCYVWDLMWNSDFYSNELDILSFQGLVDIPCGTTEEMTVKAEIADIYDWITSEDGSCWIPLEWETYDVDEYTFLAVCPPCPGPCPGPCHGPCVPMQPTGAPAALAALALVGMIGGTIYTRLK